MSEAAAPAADPAVCIQEIRAFDALDAVRAQWEQWQCHSNHDLAQFELVCGLRPEVESPFVMAIERDGRRCAIVVGRLERTGFAPSVGYLSPVRVPARVLVVIHEGVVGPLDDAAARQAVRHLQGVLRSVPVDAVAFHHLREASPMLRALQSEVPAWLRCQAPNWSMHREMLLPDQPGFIESTLRAKHRTHLRRCQKRLAAAFGTRMSWRWLSEFDDMATLCSRLEVVAAQTYQRRLGAGFFDNEEFRQRFRLFASRGQLRVLLLEIDGQVRAFWFGTVYAGVFHSSETGYDPLLRDHEVGTLMFIRMCDELSREGVQRLDFGIGDAHYKERFGNRSWREAPVWLFAPSVKGVSLMLLQRLCFVCDTAARRLLARTGLTDRIKAAWRQGRATPAKEQP